ncbi:TonB-dependent receptor [Pseudomonas sp. MMS21-TM103]|uniref:TonB-dependent receptor n=1 Tax=Pseudomonas sp. MMS21 TM103 TaxID=2886506 RepID=UPI001EDF57B0|nr:TonB-dependent receptor [Pseudomonas sp. MMS21 TM103]MCG4453743.1 TonB-dependent receptor [Pseudomonas sp. MMS21 TM103]
MNRTPLSLLIPLLGSLGAAATPLVMAAEAGAPSSDAVQLANTVVTATRSQASIASIPGSVQVIDEAQIRLQSGAGRKVADILGTLVPGLAPATGGMSNFSQSLRGRNMLVLIDGVSQNASRDNFRQLNSIAPASIERIEVVSGASSLYGAGAAGGIINIITKRHQGEELALSSRVGLSSGNNLNPKGFAYELFQSAGARQGALDWYLSADWTQRNDQFDGDGKRIPQDTSQGSAMDTETYDLHGRFGYALDADKRLSLALQDYQDQQDSGYTQRAIAGEAVAVQGLDLDDQPYTHNQAVNLNYSDNDLQGQRLLLESYWRRADALFFPDRPRGLAGVSDNNSRQDVYGLRAAVESALPDIGAARGSLVWGADYEHELTRQRGDRYAIDGLVYRKSGESYELGPDIETATQALFAQMSWDVADWTLRGGVRRQWVDSEVADSIAYGEIWQTGNRAVLPGGTLKYDATLYNLGAVYHLSDSQDLFVNFSQGFSLPDIQRFLRDVDSHFDIQTLNAQAIEVDSYELGWRGNWSRWQADITLYENRSDVTQFYDASARVLRLIDQKERVRGLESSLSYDLSERWTVGGSYAWTKGETRQDGQWIDLPATRVSPAKILLFLGYQRDRYNLRLQAVQLADYDAAAKDANGRQIDGYTLVDLLGEVELPTGRLQGGLYNLSNRHYQNLFTQANARAPFPSAEGRTLSLAYSVDW